MSILIRGASTIIKGSLYLSFYKIPLTVADCALSFPVTTLKLMAGAWGAYQLTQWGLPLSTSWVETIGKLGLSYFSYRVAKSLGRYAIKVMKKHPLPASVVAYLVYQAVSPKELASTLLAVPAIRKTALLGLGLEYVKAAYHEDSLLFPGAIRKLWDGGK